MEIVLIVLTAVAIVAACGLFLLLRRVAGEPQTLPVTAEWIDELSMDRYRPMLRLLAGDDLRYLKQGEGFSHSAVRKFRAERCDVIRGYLRWLQSDFARVSMALRVLMVQSHHDRPDLAVFLIRQKFAFHMGMAAIEMHLLVYRWGLTRIDVSGVMEAFDALRLELRQLVPSSIPVAD
jgi:hypothetical protein